MQMHRAEAIVGVGGIGSRCQYITAPYTVVRNRPGRVCVRASVVLPSRFFVGNWNQSGFLAEGRPTRTLREMLTRLQETYCGNIGYEV